MKDKHLLIRIDQCYSLATASSCSRAQYAAMLLDPERNVVLMDGYNGPPRGAGALCAGSICAREGLAGSHVEIGCHHAEWNVICNAAATGTRCAGAWLLVTGEPCVLCAKLIHHAGITKVITIVDSYLHTEGVSYLRENGVKVQHLTADQVKAMGRKIRKSRKDALDKKLH